MIHEVSEDNDQVALFRAGSVSGVEHWREQFLDFVVGLAESAIERPVTGNEIHRLRLAIREKIEEESSESDGGSSSLFRSITFHPKHSASRHARVKLISTSGRSFVFAFFSRSTEVHRNVYANMVERLGHASGIVGTVEFNPTTLPAHLLGDEERLLPVVVQHSAGTQDSNVFALVSPPSKIDSTVGRQFTVPSLSEESEPVVLGIADRLEFSHEEMKYPSRLAFGAAEELFGEPAGQEFIKSLVIESYGGYGPKDLPPKTDPVPESEPKKDTGPTPKPDVGPKHRREK